MPIITLTIAGAVAAAGGVAGLTAWLRRLWKASALRAPVINKYRVNISGDGPGDHLFTLDDDLDDQLVVRVKEGGNKQPSAKGQQDGKDKKVTLCVKRKDGMTVEPVSREPTPEPLEIPEEPRKYTCTTGRKLAKECGEKVRNAMGYPKRSPANLAVASQRCDAYLRENCPNLRHVYYKMVHTRAVFHALTPSRDEVRMAGALMSVDVTREEHKMHSRHMVRDPRVPAFIADAFGLYEPSTGDF